LLLLILGLSLSYTILFTGIECLGLIILLLRIIDQFGINLEDEVSKVSAVLDRVLWLRLNPHRWVSKPIEVSEFEIGHLCKETLTWQKGQ